MLGIPLFGRRQHLFPRLLMPPFFSYDAIHDVVDKVNFLNDHPAIEAQLRDLVRKRSKFVDAECGPTPSDIMDAVATLSSGHPLCTVDRTWRLQATADLALRSSRESSTIESPHGYFASWMGDALSSTEGQIDLENHESLRQVFAHCSKYKCDDAECGNKGKYGTQDLEQLSAALLEHLSRSPDDFKAHGVLTMCIASLAERSHMDIPLQVELASLGIKSFNKYNDLVESTPSRKKDVASWLGNLALMGRPRNFSFVLHHYVSGLILIQKKHRYPWGRMSGLCPPR